MLIALLLLAAAPSTSVHRFVHLLSGAPVGEVELRRTGDRYEYVTRRFFRRGGASEERFVPADAATWASESLIRPRPVGCWAVEDEITRQRGQACVVAVAGGRATGTLFGQPFTARYEKNTLQSLELGDSQFVHSDGYVPEYKDPFGEGFALTGSGEELALAPPIEGARRARPTPKGESEDCLAAANAWVKEHPGFELVLGLIEDEGRGWPHAWVRHRDTHEELDPSRPRAAVRYLALPRSQAPRAYLDLLGKRRTLLRVAAP